MKNKILLFVSFCILGCGSYKVTSEQKRFLLDDRNNDKYYLIQYISENQESNQIGPKPTIIIYRTDGHTIVRSDNHFDKNINLEKADIKRIEILPIKKSISLYGSAGTNGKPN